MENKDFKILVVDDNHDNLITIRALLRETFPECRVIFATDGKSGIAEARVEQPDVILLDVVMPGIDGFEVCRTLKDDKKLLDIPVIFLTAMQGDKEGRIRALESGGEAFLAKPIETAELKAQIIAMVRIRRSRAMRHNEQKRLESLIDRRTRDLVKQLSEVKKADEERKLMMAELMLAKEKAEQSDRLKSAFLANMSHEIRTPMNAIVGFCGLISDPALGASDRERYAAIIKSRSEDLMNLINDILDISKIESCTATIDNTDVLLNTIFVEVEADFRQRQHRSGKTHIRLFFDKPLDHGCDSFVSDPYIIRKVLMKLLDNALKFTEYGSITCGYKITEENTIEIYVADTGIGISAENLDVIFKTFRQGEYSDRPRFRGTGLGLAICQGLVTLLGGTITVTSSPGKGSKFTVLLPYEPASHLSYPAEKTTNHNSIDTMFDWKGKRFLLVEDEETNMEFLKIILTRTNAELVCTTSGKELRKHFHELSRFNVVLLDVRLPDGSGWDLASEIKAIRPDLPIIAQTAYAMTADRKRSKEAGCDGYVSKPIIKDKLLKTISEFL